MHRHTELFGGGSLYIMVQSKKTILYVLTFRPGTALMEDINFVPQNKPEPSHFILFMWLERTEIAFLLPVARGMCGSCKVG